MCVNKRLKSKMVKDLTDFCIQSLKYFPSMLYYLVFNIQLELKAN